MVCRGSSVVLILFLLLISGCKLLEVRDSVMTLPTVAMMGVRSQEKSFGVSAAAGMSSHDRIHVYSDALVNPPQKDTEGNVTSVGRIHETVSLGLFKSLDVGCSNNRCFWLWDLSRVWDFDKWVFSLVLGRSYEYTTESYDSTVSQWARGDYSALSKTINLGYLLDKDRLVYASLTYSQRILVTVVHQNQTNIELSRFSESHSGLQLLGGFEQQRVCRMIGVSGCFNRFEVAVTQQPDAGFSGTQTTFGFGAVLGVRW